MMSAMLAAGEPALAGLGQPSPWQLGLQESASPVMTDIIWFHDFLLYLITGIAGFVLALLIVVVVRFNARANPIPWRTTHNTLIEIAWTLIQAPVPSTQRAGRRSDGEGDRQTVVLELQLPGQRGVRVRFVDAQRCRAQGGPAAPARR
jgi:hypothetical protein